ncbi:MAG TPA: folylpolyglutamate synthase/dihydrofolate synthase family protein, partial [Roseiflexaceae bacterium]|nr:folylpolyglutamate synthase/dihydrofolate synthase family protein [Roseiflexaceae bacterium]
RAGGVAAAAAWSAHAPIRYPLIRFLSAVPLSRCLPLDAVPTLRYAVPSPAARVSEAEKKLTLGYLHTMDYQQALDYLYSFIAGERQLPRPPPELNLVRTTALLAALGSPQRAFPSVVVAGTKGKGSTCAMIEAIARAAGLRVGLWSSPHLHSYRERIQVDRRLILQAELVRLVEQVRPHVEAVTRETGGPPVTFAIGFALALRHFADAQVDLAVLEVGLGGRYDSANVVDPILSVITSISYDHMEILGRTLAEIARQKAGIMRPGVPAITVPQPPEALEALVRAAEETGAPLYVIADPTLKIEDFSANDAPQAASCNLPSVTPFDPRTEYRGPLETGLPGAYQRDNARLSAGAALLLRRAGLPIDDAAIAAGLAGARWPGRMEIVGHAPTFVLDGAHNGDSARRLVESLGELFPGRRLVLVFGTSRDKDLPRMLAELVPAADALVLTHSLHPRSLTDLAWLREQAAPLLRPGAPVAAYDDVPEALEAARALAGPRDVVCVTGSLFIVAAVREALGLEHERD